MESNSQGPEESSSHVAEGPSTLSKNKLRKSRKYKKLLESRKLKRSLEKAKKKEVIKEKGLVAPRKFRGNAEKNEANERLKLALEKGPKVVIDCQYEQHMSTKEQKRFAQQIRRAYSSNRVSESPLHLYLTSLREDSPFYSICCQQNSGFAQYILDIKSEGVTEVFGGSSQNDVVYLSPDSENALDAFEPSKVYVIGGIVDETTTKNISSKFAQGTNIATARIPIDKYFSKSESGTFKTVLTINQVVDIILEWHRSKDWVKAIQAGLPKRTGFVPVDP